MGANSVIEWTHHTFMRPTDVRARERVNYAIRCGKLPRPNDLPCADCAHEWKSGERRHEYDHYLGYAPEHHYDVQAVCTRCHSRRAIERGEFKPLNWTGRKRPGQNDNRPRRSNGTFKPEESDCG